ncbi:hypothetical protein [Telluria beijingensis]|uniref:hypothetical protein n=1 Tax=Telluria beijingensis TaxID=3068633 RepID=UPI002795D41B|nr:hypothetical protein [Massilia sp. REN29]
MNFIAFEDNFGIAKIKAPAETYNHALADSHIRSRYGVAIVGVKRANKNCQYT